MKKTFSFLLAFTVTAVCCAAQGLFGVLGGIGTIQNYQGQRVNQIVIISSGGPSIFNPIYYASAAAIGPGTTFSSVPVIVTNGPTMGCWCEDNIYVTNAGWSPFAGWAGNMISPTFFAGSGGNFYVRAGQPAFVGLSMSNGLAEMLVFYAPPNAGTNTLWTNNPTLSLYRNPPPFGTNSLVATYQWPASVIGQPTFELSTNVNWVFFKDTSATNPEGVYTLKLQ